MTQVSYYLKELRLIIPLFRRADVPSPSSNVAAACATDEPVPLPDGPTENHLIAYRYELDNACRDMRAKGIDPLDQMPYWLRQQVFTNTATLDDVLDYMAEEGYRGCSTTFMRPV
jgi:hypothetical protein